MLEGSIIMAALIIVSLVNLPRLTLLFQFVVEEAAAQARPLRRAALPDLEQLCRI